MQAILLSDGRVQRPFNWIISLPIVSHGSGDDPLLRVVEWASQDDYDTDVEAETMSLGHFAAVSVAGYALTDLQNVPDILSALQGLGGDYVGSSTI